MSSHPMNKLKLFLICSLILSSLVIVGFLALFFHFNETIKQGLENKRFLPPTEYYSAPLAISPQKLADRKEILKVFASRNYQSQELDQKIRNGEYAEATTELCLEKYPPQDSTLSWDGLQTCIAFMTKESKDPLFKKIGLQILFFDSNDQVGRVIHQDLLTAEKSFKLADIAFLEPELIAQYLDGKPLMQSYRELGQIPTQCLNAVLAIEDSNFLEHSGVSYTGFARAAIAVISSGRYKQGGSTITQQLVKNYFLTSEKTIERKAKEIFMSMLLESHASKDEILETYLNIIYLGQNGPFQIRGFGAASEYYFKKPIEEIGLPECSLLAAVLNSPGLFDPFQKPENSLKRRARVLEKMREQNFISAEEEQTAASTPLPFEKKLIASETAPYYIDAVNKEAQKMNIEFEGSTIFTGLSMNDQTAAQQAVQSGLSELETKNTKIIDLKAKGLMLEGVLISADNDSGLISAIVGGRNFRLTQFNRAVDGHRQIGSIMKPFVFLAALIRDSDKHYNPLTILKDEKFTHKYGKQSWSPDNYGKKYFGEVPMYFALKNSLNAATASLGLEIGIDKVIDVAQKLGVKSKLESVPSVLLGAFELYPMEVVEAYTSIARMGSHLPLSTIRSVVALGGNTIAENQPIAEQVIEPKKVASLVSMMKQTVQTGTAKYIFNSGFKIPAAGKTGTTSDNKDAWFAGFTPEKTTIAWVGYDSPMPNNLTGASGPVPIWLNFMKKVSSQNLTDFAWPSDAMPEKQMVTEPEEGEKEIELVL